jgi:hypothetical protein
MLRISFPAKSKHAQPVPTQVEVDSKPLTLPLLASTAGIASLLLLIAITSGSSAIDAQSNRGYWRAMSDSSNDDQAYVMGKVLSGAAAKANVIVLGTSSAREALLTDHEFSAQLRRRNASHSSLVNFASSAQSPIESLLLTEAITPREGQQFILFISHSVFQQSRPFNAIEQGGFMYPPEALIMKYAQSGIFPAYWLDERKRFVYRARAKRQELYRHLNYRLKYWIAEQVYGEPRPNYLPYLYVGLPPLDASYKERIVKTYETEFRAHLASNLTYVTNTLSVLADYLAERKCRFVIAFAPEDKHEMRKLFPNEFRIFSEMLQAAQATHKFEILDLNSNVAWEVGDFHDLTHVKESGRIKWSNALANWLAQQDSTTTR